MANTSSEPCSLEGRPRVRIVAGGGGPLAVGQFAARPVLGAASLPPGFPLIAIRPGERAFLGLFWSNWCGGDAAKVRGFRLLIILGHGLGRFTVPGHFALSPRCDAPNAGSRIGVQPFLPPSPPEPPPPKHLPLALDVIRVPPSAAPGERIRYTVTLRNRSGDALEFRKCPSYRQGIDGFTERRVLNCRPVGRLAPGERVTFAMRLVVPATALPGEVVVLWGLEPWPPEPGAKAPLLITRT